MADQDILHKSEHFLIESFASGGGEAARAELLGQQLTQQLLAKHDGQTSSEFRDDVRTFGLAFKKDNPQLRDMLMYNQADLGTVVKNGREGLRTSAQRDERQELQEENRREAVGVDDIHSQVRDEDRDDTEYKGSFQPKIAGQEGIEYQHA